MTATARHVLQLRAYAADLPTPFDDAGEVDRAALEQLCQRQVEEAASALIVCGATGEGPTLSHPEQEMIVRIAVAASHGRIPVIADTSSNSTAQAIELARDAERGGDRSLVSRTSVEVCKASAAPAGRARVTVLSTHLARIDDLRLRRAFQAAVELEQESPSPPSDTTQRNLWMGLRR